MSKARSILAALAMLCVPLHADGAGRGMPSQPFPALAAASLVYTIVPNPLGARTWGERNLEQIRLGVTNETHEELGPVAIAVLASVHLPSAAYALQPTEAPKGDDFADGTGGTQDHRILGAFEAMGLSPEDLVAAPETPMLALKAANTVDKALHWSGAQLSALRRLFRGEASLRVERPELRSPRPDFVRFEKPPETPAAPPFILGKTIVRSVYKMLLGVAIGILIWGMVRQSA